MPLKSLLGWICALILLMVSTAGAAKLVLNDGTTLEGTVIKTSDGYWIKLSDGSSKIVPNEQVQSYSEESAGDSGSSTGDAGDASEEFRMARGRADGAESALAAVSIWQEFIDKYPDSPDIDTAKSELARWQKLADNGAERINGKWVGGDDRKKILAQAEDLTRQAVEMLNQNQTLQAIDKLKQSVNIYPNSFMTNFCLGYVSMGQKDYDEAAQYFSASTRLKPQSPEAENDLAVANLFRNRFDVAIDEFLSAARIHDSKDVVQNLVTALALEPSDLRTLPKMKPTLEAANLLEEQYNINGPTSDYRLILLPPPYPQKPAAPGPDDGQQPGPELAQGGWSGTGFFISSSGLILTNRHVAKGSKTLMVLMPDGTKASAHVVAIDDQYDLALIQLNNPSHNVSVVRLAPEDSPAEGADCVVMGFPMIDELGADMKITRGVVSSASQDQGNGADVLTDAKVNPGNSGGPIADKFGNVMAIVCMKSITTGEYDSYGIGISAGHIREFLHRNNVSVDVGPESGEGLSTEDVVTKVKPATVCIVATE